MIPQLDLGQRQTIAFAGLVLAFFLILSSSSPVFAVLQYSPGLKAGDTASYTLYHKSYTLASNMKVLSVTGTTVEVNFPDYPSYGIVLGDMALDVFSGYNRSSVPSLVFAVGTGLNKGDPIYNGAPITMTAQQLYSCGVGVNRQQVYTQVPIPGQPAAQISWDQGTGLMCNYQSNYFNGTVALGLILAGTSVFGSTGGNGLDPFVLGQVIVSLFGLILVVLVVFVYFRRRRRRSGSRAK